MDAIPKTYRQRMEEICRDYPDHRDELYEEMYRCPKCERLYGRLYFRIEYGLDQVFERPMKCHLCKCGLDTVDDPHAALPKLRCPKCKQHTLVEGLKVLWD